MMEKISIDLKKIKSIFFFKENEKNVSTKRKEKKNYMKEIKNIMEETYEKTAHETKQVILYKIINGFKFLNY